MEHCLHQSIIARPVALAQNYLPVCGVDGKDYPNKCAAECNGVKVASQGVCKPFFQPCKCPKVTGPRLPYMLRICMRLYTNRIVLHANLLTVPWYHLQNTETHQEKFSD